jgi:hypothetical protein
MTLIQRLRNLLVLSESSFLQEMVKKAKQRELEEKDEDYLSSFHPLSRTSYQYTDKPQAIIIKRVIVDPLEEALKDEN